MVQAQTVLDQYEARAQTFEEFVTSYQQSLDADERLYSLMRGSVDPNLVKIKRAIRERNIQYAQLAEIRKQFNKQTKAFNVANAKLVQMEQASQRCARSPPILVIYLIELAFSRVSTSKQPEATWTSIIAYKLTEVFICEIK